MSAASLSTARASSGLPVDAAGSDRARSSDVTSKDSGEGGRKFLLALKKAGGNSTGANSTRADSADASSTVGHAHPAKTASHRPSAKATEESAPVEVVAAVIDAGAPGVVAAGVATVAPAAAVAAAGRSAAAAVDATAATAAAPAGADQRASGRPTADTSAPPTLAATTLASAAPPTLAASAAATDTAASAAATDTASASTTLSANGLPLPGFTAVATAPRPDAPALDAAIADASAVIGRATSPTADGPATTASGAKPADATALSAFTIGSAAAPTSAPSVTPVTTVAAAVPTAPAQTPSDQVVTALIPLRSRADGVHQLSISLHPAELGPIHIIARLEHGTLQIDLSSGSDAARSTLRDALPQLRADLLQGGFTGVGVNLGHDSSRQSHSDRAPDPYAQRNETPTPTPTNERRPFARSRAPAGRLDALL